MTSWQHNGGEQRSRENTEVGRAGGEHDIEKIMHVDETRQAVEKRRRNGLSWLFLNWNGDFGPRLKGRAKINEANHKLDALEKL